MHKKLFTAAVVLFSASAAIAADPHGLLTLVVGVPLLLAANVVLGIMLALRPGRTVRIISRVLFCPTLAYSLYVALDARTLLRDIGSENSMIGLAFFFLLAVACLLFYGVNARRPVKD